MPAGPGKLFACKRGDAYAVAMVIEEHGRSNVMGFLFTKRAKININFKITHVLKLIFLHSFPLFKKREKET